MAARRERAGRARLITELSDGKIAAIYFLGLHDSELLQRVLLGVLDSVKTEIISDAVRRAVEAFKFALNTADARNITSSEYL